MPSRRGAQPGNKNALKHGFYSRSFRQIESNDLLPAADLQLINEINLLRVYIRRLSLIDPMDVKEQISILNAISLASDRLATIAHKQYIISGNQDAQISQAFDSALEKFLNELKED